MYASIIRRLILAERLLVIQVQEFGTLLRQLGIDFDAAEVQKQFHTIDLDGDGRIDVYEFEKWMKALRRQVSSLAQSVVRCGQ